MALFSRSIKHPVSGTARVMSVLPRDPGGSGTKSCHLTLNVQAPGVPAFTTEMKTDAPVASWPKMGSVLPVTVDRAKPARMQIEWNRVTSGAQVPEPAPAVPTPVATAPPPPVVTAADDPILARLTKLRDRGILTPVEFEQQKQRMLG